MNGIVFDNEYGDLGHHYGFFTETTGICWFDLEIFLATTLFYFIQDLRSNASAQLWKCE